MILTENIDEGVVEVGGTDYCDGYEATMIIEHKHSDEGRVDLHSFRDDGENISRYLSEERCDIHKT